MIERLLTLKRRLTVFASDNEGTILLPTSNQWNLLKSTHDLLKPFQQITTSMSRDEALISEMIPTVESLKKYLREINTPGSGTLRERSEQDSAQSKKTNVSLSQLSWTQIFDEEGRNEIKTEVLSECQRINQKNSEDRTESNNETPIVIGDEIYLESDEEAPLVVDVISRKPSPYLWECLKNISNQRLRLITQE
ncbi:hypothetical protein HHI36_014210 [Cryptolaemus montrouzieri]|uniref:Uncharacterized protein n=1 Tax=Cryptolaemus montrouzieri TaxID=559131 RepID=A0ABD2N1U3_9CUCU